MSHTHTFEREHTSAIAILYIVPVKLDLTTYNIHSYYIRSRSA